MSGLKRTDVSHTQFQRIFNSLSVWARGVMNIFRLKKLLRANKEGGVSHDLRGGRR